jgi:hypothetical protein
LLDGDEKTLDHPLSRMMTAAWNIPVLRRVT